MAGERVEFTNLSTGVTIRGMRASPTAVGPHTGPRPRALSVFPATRADADASVLLVLELGLG